MANRICTGCGLTTDSSGRLIPNTASAVWPYACAETNGVKIRCGADGVLRSAMPEKYNLVQRMATTLHTGTLTALAPADGNPHDLTPTNSMVVTNPSPCLPMQLLVSVGLAHALLTKTGAGNTHVSLSSRLSVTGAIVDAASDGGHQIWQLNGSTAGRFDTQNSLNRRQYVLPAGGTATFTLRDVITVFTYNGDSTVTNWNSTCVVEGFSLGTGQVGFTG